MNKQNYDISYCESLNEYYLCRNGNLIGVFNTLSGAEAEMENDLAQRAGDPEMLRTKIKSAKSLRNLHDALCALEATLENDECAENHIDICALPIFGGDEPRATDGVWSWDNNQLLVGEGKFSEWYLIDREDWEASR
jgi:hypothetical protein